MTGIDRPGADGPFLQLSLRCLAGDGRGVAWPPAPAWQRMKEKVTAFRFILGEMVDYSGKEPDALDLLNEDLSLDGALQLNDLAREAVEFLKLDSTSIRTLEPNFCHAKLFLFQHTNGRRTVQLLRNGQLEPYGVRIGHEAY